MNQEKIVVGNLKLNIESLKMREEYLAEVAEAFVRLPENTEVVLCPPALYVERFAGALSEVEVSLGAQDCFWELHGKYTGQISPKTLDDFGVSHVIIGHSERRALGESDEIISKKCVTALRANLHPIICVGFINPDEEELHAVKREVVAALKGIAIEDYKNIIFAYEPVWAIGSGKTPSADEIHTMILYIRKIIAQYGPAKDVRILYGGSVSPENAVSVGRESHADGVLVGGASLQPEKFVRIVKNINQ